MGATKLLAFAGVTTALITTTAIAADFPAAARPEMVQVPLIESGWYFRGDIGMTNQQVKTLENALFSTMPNLVVQDKNFEAGMLFGVGFGYKWNNWLRVDVTGEYRGETGFSGFATWTDTDPVTGGARFNNFSAKKSEWLVLVNAYLDLGTWWYITPFIGGGIGWSYVTIHGFRDAGMGNDAVLGPFPTVATANSASRSNFAWALHGGLSYEVTKAFTVELAYRYVNLGTGATGDIISFDGTSTGNPMFFKDIISHDVKLGVRWLLQPEPVNQPALMRRG